MTTQTTTAPMALHVPKHFTYTDRGLQRASDWVRYTVHPGLYRIGFVTGSWTPLPGNTKAEAMAAGMAKADSFSYPVDRTAFMPYYAVATLTATKVASYYENQVFTAISGHEQEHDELTTITYRPYAYEIEVGKNAYVEWVGEPSSRKLVHHATIVELQPCDECKARAGERCEEGCQGAWDGVAANAGSAS